jgi:fructose-1,6-bisphosphatase/inositol monophosphatase family enzyme
MVALGKSAFSVFPGNTAHDIAPAAILVAEANGRVTDVAGQPHPGIGLSLFEGRLLAASLGGKMHIESSANAGTAVSISFPTR